MSETIPVEELSYEAARAELVKVVQDLEAGTQTLDQAMALWERGEALAERCQQSLDGAKARIAARTGNRAGSPTDGSEPGSPNGASGPGLAGGASGVVESDGGLGDKP
ncbi:MAG: exodeoxyribonuclease VII small subunit [Bifidobacteriaceae bacterium]|jgi:exodeoxyribonuclease VII small subunit|nr:exodeoxyribonuclease VII small subunit [Bifidobacteriaceae bacterium]